jgi:NADPH-dependent glutamate synthase beta subunit-like oxidoreductase
MSDRFQPITMEQLTDWVFTELEEKDSIFGIPRASFFVPDGDDRFRVENYGVTLDTPFGVAAGPATQMAQNIIVSWLVGARFIELKTVQTLDELDVNKPCIDLEDEGYNVEWSQELKVYQSFDEYLRAWVLIHALHRKLGFPGDAPGMIFNMSVGYDLKGIQQPNVQWYLDVMDDSSEYIGPYIDIVARRYEDVRDLDIPAQLSNTMTLSTMHGCPPEEIEQISTYLITERGLNTSVKCNPTLLGAERVRGIINDELGFSDVVIPDEAFGHDLKYVDAVPMFHNLRRIAATEGVTFGLKLSNTLEVENHRLAFPDDDMMYLSGRALHAVTTNLALRLSEEFRGDLLLSFAGGADAFNVSDLLRSGMTTITVCSDLLKTGGYLRMPQYIEELNLHLDKAGATTIADFTGRTALSEHHFSMFAEMLALAMFEDTGVDFSLDNAHTLAVYLAGEWDKPIPDVVRDWALENDYENDRAAELVAVTIRTMARVNLRGYAQSVQEDWRYRNESFRMDRSKTSRKLGLFDCLEAPCVDECPVSQDVPAYMRAVREGRFDDAVEITRADNPVPAILGRVCDHLCENTCIRTHLDQPLAIRDMKRFIMSHETWPKIPERVAAVDMKVAIIGAGPAGIAAGEALGKAGFSSVTIFEAHPYAGGMVGGAIPAYRLPQHEIDKDVAVLGELGVEIKYNQKAGRDFTLEDLRDQGFEKVFVGVGAQLPKYLGVEGEDAAGVLDALSFLRSVREGHPIPVGPRVGVIGAGDTAMDCVRSAWRVGATDVSLIYRRSKDQMPADPEEIHACIEEGIDIVEMTSPHSLHVEDDTLFGLIATRTEYRGDRDSSGRKVPHDVPDSEFEIPLDTLILAISQHSMLDFFGDNVPELTPRDYIAVDPVSFESSVPGVYAGGDVAAGGPSSIVKAAADGKAAAAAIIATVTGEVEATVEGMPTTDDLGALIQRRAHREYRVPAKFTPLTLRNNFNETMLMYTAEEAQTEASRCVDCDTICSLCVGVCPNLALMTYQTDAFAADLPSYTVQAGVLVESGRTTFSVDQAHQIVVLTDFCNECGNCVTSCPTSGKPYEDKPRLYLNQEEFDGQSENAFMVTVMGDTTVVYARFGGETHRMSINGTVEYTSPMVSASFDASFDLVSAGAGDAATDGGAVSLEPAATMYVVWKGLDGSMPELPIASKGGTRITAPAM